MLLSYQAIESVQLKKDLELIEHIYTQDTFMSGLFLGSALPKDLEGFRVFRDPINLDMRIQTPGYCSDEPEKWPFQNMPYILDDERSRVKYDGVYKDLKNIMLTKKKYKEILKGFSKDFGCFSEQRMIDLRTKEHDSAMQKEFSLTEVNVEYIFYHLIPDIIHAHFVQIVDAAIFGGIEHSPIAERLLDCYRLGGMPGGWVGPKPEDGGDVMQCMELYHLGE
ncbi:hypothetical protein [Pseudoalteromonas piscicida]|uniref:Uncharacterized protein n=1 Tax=Pseudoalteromonas piscicida TaxID=43662 RepID=A0A2A5JL64_PSEO7|nr:hypothetical protein [Pseudoalteromonas piscicida]PCK30193.1 hypothetical protein CEX98_18740 [Pseudoalteromonas piscicida]